jgi:hypothetical protein
LGTRHHHHQEEVHLLDVLLDLLHGFPRDDEVLLIDRVDRVQQPHFVRQAPERLAGLFKGDVRVF